MDKNSLWGLLLMGVVIFGFMYLNQPSAEERARMEREHAEQEALAIQQANPGEALTIDSVSAGDREALINTVKLFGVADSATGSRTLNSGNVTISLNSDNTIGGHVAVQGVNVPVSDIIKADYDNVPRAAAIQAVADLKQALSNVARYKGFARYISGDSMTVKLENKYLAIDVTNKGAQIARAMLKDYKRYDSTAVCPIDYGTDSYGFILTSATQRFDTREFFFNTVKENDSTVVAKLDLGDGAVWGIRYTLPADAYTVRMDVFQQGMENVIPSSVGQMDFEWNQVVARNESGRMFEERNSALYYMCVGGDVDNLSESSSDRKELTERIKWIGFKNQFFSTVLISQENFSGADLDSEALEKNPNFVKGMKADAHLDYQSTKANPASFVFFIGPNSYPLLSDLSDTIVPETDLHLTKLIPLGWPIVRWINTLIVIPLFDFLGKYIANYGIIILLLTIFIKIILFPFTYKSYMSQAKMRVLAPEIKQINDKYPGQENAMKRQQETMALYSRAGASPFSGCLPMLLQFPILIAMFNFFPSAIELRGQSFLWAKDLSAPDAIFSWTTNIPFISGTFGNHVSLFCLLMTVTNIIYTRITMQSQPTGNSMPGMKWMMYLMPLMFLFFFNNYASGLSYYYFLSLLITIVQTYIFRHVVDEEKVRAQLKANARKPKKKSGFMARLEEAQRRQQALLKEQEKQRGKRR